MILAQSVRSLLAGLASTLALGVLAPAAAQETIKVGLLFTYSGPSALAGQINDNVIKMFQQKYGATVGGTKIEFVRRDTTGPNPEVAKRLAQELIVREKVNVIIGPDFTPNVLAVAPLLTEAKIPAIVTGAATSGIIEKSPYLMRTFFSIPQVVRPMAQWAWRDGIRKPFVVVADYGPGHDSEATFTKAFAEAGGSTAGSLRVSLRNPEFSSYMQRIKDAKPDAAFVFMPAGELSVQFLKAYADTGLKGSVKLIATGDLTDEAMIDAAGDAGLGVVTSGIYSPLNDSPMNRQFVADYKAQFNNNPRMNWSSVGVWDAMRMIYDGIAAQKGKLDADKFVAFTRGRNFESPRGMITIDKDSGDIVQSVQIRRVEKRDGGLFNVPFETIKDVSPR